MGEHHRRLEEEHLEGGMGIWTLKLMRRRRRRELCRVVPGQVVALMLKEGVSYHPVR